MSDEVLVAVVTTIGVVLSAVVTGGFAILHKTQKNRDEKNQQVQETIREQVQNSHGTNLRNDIDRVLAVVESVQGDVRGIRKDVGRLDQRDMQRGHDFGRLEEKLDDHLAWSAEWSRARERDDQSAAQRLSSIESTLDPNRKQ